MGKIEAVVFDIGRVLINWEPEAFYDGVIGVQARQDLFAEVDLHEMNDDIDRGEDWAARVEKCALAHPTHADPIRLWHSRWIEMASPAIDHSVRVLRALRRAKVPVHALSNFGIGTFREAERHYPFLEEFDMRILSGEEGVIKPDARIYEILEERTGLSGDALIFADDRADNIAAASARGWRTHLFESPEGWAARLVSEGLLSAEAAT